MKRNVAHSDLDPFFVRVARLQNSALERKAIIIGGSSDRGVVAPCSYEARVFDVHSASSINLSRRLCPSARDSPNDLEIARFWNY